MIFVDGENTTGADPCGPLTSILVPDTESMDPLTSSSPLTFDGAADDAFGELVLEEPHATADNATIPTIASIE